MDEDSLSKESHTSQRLETGGNGYHGESGSLTRFQQN